MKQVWKSRVHSIQSSFPNSLFCDICGGNDHINNDGNHRNPFTSDGCNFISNFQRKQQDNPYSSTYNPGRRNH